MALTGKGIETNPYIIRSYDDLRESQTATPESGDILYLKLGSNINCKDYGDQFLWYTIKYDNYITIIDMNNHCIKNPLIAQDNSLFEFNVEPTTHYSRMYNGDILNVYSRNARYVFYSSVAKSTLHFSNIKFSINLNTLTYGCFTGCLFDTCSMHLLCDDVLFSMTSNNSIFNLYNENIVTSTIIPNVEACVSKCDMLLEITPTNSYSFLMRDSKMNGGQNSLSFSNCRIQGKVNSNFKLDAQGQNWRTGVYSSYHYFSSTIVNLVATNNVGTSYGLYCRCPQYNGHPHYNNVFYVKAYNGTGNVLIISNEGGTSVGSPEIFKDAEYLKSIEFPVEEI